VTRKERFEAALRQEEVDRLPFWVKVFGASYKMLQPEPWRSMDELELADYLDLDHYAGGPAPVRCSNERVRVRADRRDGRQVTCYQTPDGTLTGANGFDAGSHSWHPVEFPIKTREDILAARHLFEGNRWAVDNELVERGRERIEQVGDRGIVYTGAGISPLMQLIQHYIGPEATYYFLQDYPDEMEHLIGVMHEERLRYLRTMLPACPYEWVVSGENTSTTLLSPAVFERYPWRHLKEYGDLIVAHGKSHQLHQCGTLHDLLPMINELPATVIEAYSCPPIGDTPLSDRTALAPSMAVIGGTCANTWLQPVEAICETMVRDLRAAGGLRGVVFTSAGVMPPGCPIEKIAQVREFARGVTWETVAG